MRMLSVMLVLLMCTIAHAKVKLGIDVLRDDGFKPLSGLRVGLVANPASVDSNLVPTAVVLHEAAGVKLVALFGPEHGVWGDEWAGDKVPDRRDPRLGLPVFSLYGKTRKPTPEMLAGVDVLVFDLQDIGARSYTYISTLKELVIACGEQGKKLVVLDRPNPLGGERVEGGPVTDEKFRSFVSHLDVPYLHGMTTGELAVMLREQHAPTWDGLTVIKMQGWTRGMTWSDTGLEWVPTSPHIPHVDSIAGYASTGIAGELSSITIGVGYTMPFQLAGKPGADGEAIADKLNKLWPDAPKGSVFFRPAKFKPFYAAFKGEGCGGVQIHIDPKTAPSLVEINFRIMEALGAKEILEAAPTRHDMFDKCVGSDDARLALLKGESLEPVFAKWRAYCDEFKAKRKPWLLY
jgi:uncharacterized protein YbbC (DUF1343 family)